MLVERESPFGDLGRRSKSNAAFILVISDVNFIKRLLGKSPRPFAPKVQARTDGRTLDYENKR